MTFTFIVVRLLSTKRTEEFLKNLGLSDKEILLYLASLQYGSSLASVIARKTGIARSTVNFVFDELVQKGLASKDIKNGSVYFSALSPEFLENLLLGKMAAVKKSMADFKEILPALCNVRSKHSNVPKIQYFEGVEGLCRMLDDFCAVDQTVLYISGHNMMSQKIREYVYAVYLPISNKHENKNKIILNDGTKAREYKNLAAKAYDEFIFIDPEKFPLTLTTAIYGDKVAFWSYDPEDMTGVIIENTLIAENMRTMYNAMKNAFIG